MNWSAVCLVLQHQNHFHFCAKIIPVIDNKSQTSGNWQPLWLSAGSGFLFKPFGLCGAPRTIGIWWSHWYNLLRFFFSSWWNGAKEICTRWCSWAACAMQRMQPAATWCVVNGSGEKDCNITLARHMDWSLGWLVPEAGVGHAKGHRGWCGMELGRVLVSLGVLMSSSTAACWLWLSVLSL